MDNDKYILDSIKFNSLILSLERRGLLDKKEYVQLCHSMASDLETDGVINASNDSIKNGINSMDKMLEAASEVK